MQKRFLIPYIGCIALFLAGAIYVYLYENRSAAHFSAYCHIDFRGVREQADEQAVAAVLAVYDYSYLNKTLRPECTLTIDGEKITKSALKALKTKPSYSLEQYDRAGFLQYNNMLVFVFENDLLAKISQAQDVQIAISYENTDKVVDLPLSKADLSYWKNEIK